MDFTGAVDLIPTTAPQDTVDALFELVPASSTAAVQIVILAALVGLVFRIFWKATKRVKGAA